MKTMKATVGAVWLATAAATVGLAGRAHADDAPVNLPVTDDVSAQLLQAGAVLTDHPASDYTGLKPGKTYYAHDPNNDTYWAGAALSGPKTFDAGVMLQDANSYMVFRKEGQGGTWVAYRTGYGSGSAMPPDGTCPLPQAVHDLWQWTPGYCNESN